MKINIKLWRKLTYKQKHSLIKAYAKMNVERGVKNEVQ